jgi:hypothetical protein
MVKPPLIEQWYFPQIKVVLSVRVYVLNKNFFCTSSFSSSCHLELSIHLEAPASVSEIIVEWDEELRQAQFRNHSYFFNQLVYSLISYHRMFQYSTAVAARTCFEEKKGRSSPHLKFQDFLCTFSLTVPYCIYSFVCTAPARQRRKRTSCCQWARDSGGARVSWRKIKIRTTAENCIASVVAVCLYCRVHELPLRVVLLPVSGGKYVRGRQRTRGDYLDRQVAVPWRPRQAGRQQRRRAGRRQGRRAGRQRERNAGQRRGTRVGQCWGDTQAGGGGDAQAGGGEDALAGDWGDVLAGDGGDILAGVGGQRLSAWVCGRW